MLLFAFIGSALFAPVYETSNKNTFHTDQTWELMTELEAGGWRDCDRPRPGNGRPPRCCSLLA